MKLFKSSKKFNKLKRLKKTVKAQQVEIDRLKGKLAVKTQETDRIINELTKTNEL